MLFYRRLLQLILLGWLFDFLLIAAITAAPSEPIEDRSDQTVIISISGDENSSLNLTVNISEWHTRQVQFKDAAYRQDSFIEEPFTIREGWPMLPMIMRVVRVPPDSDIILTLKAVDSFFEDDINPFIVPPQDGSVSLDISGTPSLEYTHYDGF